MAISLLKGSQGKFKLDLDFTGNLPVTQIGSGYTTPSINNFLRGDGQWLNSPDKPPSYLRQFAWMKDPGSTNLVGWNCSTGPGTFGTASNINDATGEYIQYVTANTSILTTAGWNSTFTILALQYKPVITMIIKTTSNAADLINVRMTFGIASGDMSASDNPALHIMGFRYSTTADSLGFWSTYTKDGTNANVKTTTASIAISSVYILKIDASNLSSIKFFINGVLVNTHTTNLPSLTQLMGLSMLATNVTAQAHTILINKFFVELGF